MLLCWIENQLILEHHDLELHTRTHTHTLRLLKEAHWSTSPQKPNERANEKQNSLAIEIIKTFKTKPNQQTNYFKMTITHKKDDLENSTIL